MIPNFGNNNNLKLSFKSIKYNWIQNNEKSPKHNYLFHSAPYLLLMIIPNKDKNLWLNSIDALSFKFTPNHLPVFIPLSHMHITLFRIAKCLNGGLLNHPLLFLQWFKKNSPRFGAAWSFGQKTDNFSSTIERVCVYQGGFK